MHCQFEIISLFSHRKVLSIELVQTGNCFSFFREASAYLQGPVECQGRAWRGCRAELWNHQTRSHRPLGEKWTPHQAEPKVWNECGEVLGTTGDQEHYHQRLWGVLLWGRGCRLTCQSGHQRYLLKSNPWWNCKYLCVLFQSLAERSSCELPFYCFVLSLRLKAEGN